MIELITYCIRQDFSLEQASGYLARKHALSISHETIYKHIWSNKRYGGTLYKHLRHSSRKRRKRYGTKQRCGRIKGQVSIDLRPAVVDAKRRDRRLGDRYRYGQKQQGYLITVVERRSKMTLIKRVPDKQSDQMAKAVIKLMRPYKESVLTITPSRF